MIENDLLPAMVIMTWLITLLGVILMVLLSSRVKRMEVSIDGRMEELLRTTRVAATAMGNLKGRSEQTQERSDAADAASAYLAGTKLSINKGQRSEGK